MLYFAYGSNMSLLRLRQRVPSARFVAVSTLRCHQLRFHKIGMDGSGKCDILETGEEGDWVTGVVFDIHRMEKPALDRAEDLDYGYGEKSVQVLTIQGELLQTRTYYALRTDNSLKPFHWYKEHVVQGAREHDLPEEYIQTIERVVSVSDPQSERHILELAIYR